MAGEKVIAVIGATGAQGGGLVRAILADPSGGFKVRAITRNKDSDKAKALAAQGVEVVVGDLDDEKSLQKAFTGAYGAFCVTNFWEHFSGEKEYEQAGNLARACKAAGIQHAVWSTLEDTRKWVPTHDTRMPTLQGKYTVAHFDAKADANEFFRKLGVPTTFLHTTFYWENLIYFGMGPKKGPDGKYALTFPMGKAKLSGIAGEHITVADMAKTLSKALGVEIIYNEVTPDQYRSFGFPGAEDVGNMFQIYQEFGKPFMDFRPLETARSLNPALMSFDKWVAANKSRIPLE